MGILSTMSQITVDIPDAAMAGLSPVELACEVKLAAAIHLYDQKRFTLSQAAAFAGILPVEFRQIMGSYGISEFQMTKEDLARELVHG